MRNAPFEPTQRPGRRAGDRAPSCRQRAVGAVNLRSRPVVVAEGVRRAARTEIIDGVTHTVFPPRVVPGRTVAVEVR